MAAIAVIRSTGGSANGTVDTMGLLLRVVVHPANMQERDGARLVLTGLEQRFTRLHHLWTDQA